MLCPSAKVRQLVCDGGRVGRVGHEVRDVSTTLRSGNENGEGKKVKLNAMSGRDAGRREGPASE